MNHETDGTKQNINCKINNVFVVATNTAVNHYLKNNQKKKFIHVMASQQT